MNLPAPLAVRPRRGKLPELLAGRYRIERLLGAGGMGAVYRARDLLREQYGDPEPLVALKILASEFADHPDADTLLHSEFALTSRLHHPHVVRAHAFDVDQASGHAFIILELLRGPTLDRLLDERPEGLPWSELGEIAVALAAALAHSHRHGVLHGDLKPGNAILAEDGLRLIDYGLGQPQEGMLPGLPRLNRERFAAWTPRYAAPELLDGAPLAAAADVYALACLLYELSTGRHPFARLDARQARERGLESRLSRPPRMPPDCWTALRTALAMDPARRHIDAAGLLAALRRPAPTRLRRWLGFGLR